MALTANVAELLRRWEGGPEPVAELASRPEWLLDGWEQISLLWKSATDHAARAAVMPELADLVSVIPREAGDWVGTQVEDQMWARFRKLVGRNEDWRTGGKVLDLINR